MGPTVARAVGIFEKSLVIKILSTDFCFFELERHLSNAPLPSLGIFLDQFLRPDERELHVYRHVFI